MLKILTLNNTTTIEKSKNLRTQCKTEHRKFKLKHATNMNKHKKQTNIIKKILKKAFYSKFGETLQTLDRSKSKKSSGPKLFKMFGGGNGTQKNHKWACFSKKNVKSLLARQFW